MHDLIEQFEYIWEALHNFRGFDKDECSIKDKEWDDICLAMSIIENECGLERTNGSLVKKQTIWELRRKQQTKE